MPITYCQECGKQMDIPQCRIDAGRGKFCSRICHAKHTFTGMKRPPRSNDYRRKLGACHKGKTPPNKKPSVSITCGICKKVFEVPNRRKEKAKFCSRECHNEAKRRVIGPSHPLWTKVEKSCEWCGKKVWVKPAKLHEFRYCSRKCAGTAISFKLAQINGPTSIEQLLIDELDKRGIAYITQYRIANWLVDIAIPDCRIAIEADGEYWHSNQAQKVKDANKDHWLKSHKWAIFRFWGHQIENSPKNCIDQVVAHINLQ